MALLSRSCLARVLAAVMILTSVFNVVAVECRAGDHQAVELIGHQAEAAACDEDDASGNEPCAQHDHHPADCSDRPLLEPVTPPGVQDQLTLDADAPVVAILLPRPPWLQTTSVDPRTQPGLCPRPPPRLLTAAEAFADTIRLLI